MLFTLCVRRDPKQFGQNLETPSPLSLINSSLPAAKVFQQRKSGKSSVAESLKPEMVLLRPGWTASACHPLLRFSPTESAVHSFPNIVSANKEAKGGVAQIRHIYAAHSFRNDKSELQISDAVSSVA